MTQLLWLNISRYLIRMDQNDKIWYYCVLCWLIDEIDTNFELGSWPAWKLCFILTFHCDCFTFLYCNIQEILGCLWGLFSPSLPCQFVLLNFMLQDMLVLLEQWIWCMINDKLEASLVRNMVHLGFISPHDWTSGQLFVFCSFHSSFEIYLDIFASCRKNCCVFFFVSQVKLNW